MSKKTTRAASTSTVILTARKHNLRSGGGDNVVLCGATDAANAAQVAANVMRRLDVVVRKNAAVGIEIIVTLSTDTPIDTAAYFKVAADSATKSSWNRPQARVTSTPPTRTSSLCLQKLRS